MTSTTNVNTFVTGAAGFIGTALVGVLLDRGHRVCGLTPSMEAAPHVGRAGAVPVLGDLLARGQCQDHAAGVEWVFNLPPHSTCGPRVSFRYPTFEQGLPQVLGGLHE